MAYLLETRDQILEETMAKHTVACCADSRLVTVPTLRMLSCVTDHQMAAPITCA